MTNSNANCNVYVYNFHNIPTITGLFLQPTITYIVHTFLFILMALNSTFLFPPRYFIRGRFHITKRKKYPL